MASTLRRSWIANRYRNLLIAGVLLFVVVAAPVGLLIHSFGGFPHPQQEARQVDPRCSGNLAQSTETRKPGDGSNDIQIAEN
jgi:hypothetical protein